MIKTRYPGEWTCTDCDASHNGYVSTQVWWRGTAPKVCWRCVIRKWSKPAKTENAAHAIADALAVERREFANASQVRDCLYDLGVVVKGVAPTRLAAMVFRILRGMRRVFRELSIFPDILTNRIRLVT